jgi:peptide/nickel transport system ATP-binding protein
MTLLSVRDLVVEIPSRRGLARVIDGVTFDIEKGEILGIVGESGAGKSLTGTAITGLLPNPGRIAGGMVLLDGQRIDDLPPGRMRRLRGRRIGMIFQDPLTTLDPLFTIGQQLVETMRTHLNLSASETLRRARDWLDRVGIPGADRRIDAYPHEFSGGQRQRVVIALALCAEPELLIADEPTTALDVSVQAHIIALLRGLARERGTAVMLITHDMGVIAEIADRVAVMYAGRIAEIGPVDAVIHHPVHPYTDGLMGTIPSVTYRLDRLRQIDGTMPRPDSMPTGCAFHPRCPKVFDRCRLDRPALKPAGASLAACWLA